MKTTLTSTNQVSGLRSTSQPRVPLRHSPVTSLPALGPVLADPGQVTGVILRIGGAGILRVDVEGDDVFLNAVTPAPRSRVSSHGLTALHFLHGQVAAPGPGAGRGGAASSAHRTMIIDSRQRPCLVG